VRSGGVFGKTWVGHDDLCRAMAVSYARHDEMRTSGHVCNTRAAAASLRESRGAGTPSAKAPSKGSKNGTSLGYISMAKATEDTEKRTSPELTSQTHPSLTSNPAPATAPSGRAAARGLRVRLGMGGAHPLAATAPVGSARGPRTPPGPSEKDGDLRARAPRRAQTGPAHGGARARSWARGHAHTLQGTPPQAGARGYEEWRARWTPAALAARKDDAPRRMCRLRSPRPCRACCRRRRGRRARRGRRPRR